MARPPPPPRSPTQMRSGARTRWCRRGTPAASPRYLRRSRSPRCSIRRRTTRRAPLAPHLPTTTIVSSPSARPRMRTAAAKAQRQGRGAARRPPRRRRRRRRGRETRLASDRPHSRRRRPRRSQRHRPRAAQKRRAAGRRRMSTKAPRTTTRPRATLGAAARRAQARTTSTAPARASARRARRNRRSVATTTTAHGTARRNRATIPRRCRYRRCVWCSATIKKTPRHRSARRGLGTSLRNPPQPRVLSLVPLVSMSFASLRHHVASSVLSAMHIVCTTLFNTACCHSYIRVACVPPVRTRG